MVKNNVKDEDLQSSVLNVTKIFRKIVIEHYQKICNSYKDWYNINYSEARIFWKDITKEQVKHELEIMAGEKSLYRRCQNQNDLIASIEYLALIPSYIECLKCLSQVLTQFRVRDTDKSWAVEILKDLQNDAMKLNMLSDIFQNLDRNFNELNECTWSLVKEFNSADEFIKYLLENLIETDLTNLINAIDDLSDTKLLQENTVAALIEVNKALNPLNKDAAQLSTTSFLKCLSEVSQKNPSLAKKISSCSSHNLALQNMHRNIAKRGEVTKEQIKNAATIASYNIAELRNLCSHALLIGKSRASIDYLVDDDSTEDISMLMNQFIMQVDLAQQITSMASRLIQYGYFLYQKMLIEAHGTPDLKNLSIDYSYDDLYDNFHASNQEICQNLVQFVNDKAKLPRLPNWTGEWPIVQSEADFLLILSKIGEVLHNIFTDIPQ
ncbi:e3 ubiquitin-protein ligase [Gigaspora margarita]|uniref:E3 ubiquitin-protein ligase n=1 Tax=Gigaspora margarita TaxID=4874 RepID=A0A8H4B3J4_GIGMA|nr:e3 ubiquitin-protein ligase [Gigaspora margarita]